MNRLLATVAGFCGAAITTLPLAQAASAARDLGPTDPSQVIDISVVLKLPAQADFDHAVDARYDPASPAFHHWMTQDDIKQFAPTLDRIETVRAALRRAGLTLDAADPIGFSVNAHGTAGAVARAFQTDLHDFSAQGVRYRAPLTEPRLAGPAAADVAYVTGIESHPIHPMRARAIDQRTGQPYAPIALSAVRDAGGLSSIITDQILGAPGSFTYKTPGASLPTATYAGLVYNPTQPLAPDYTAAQLEDIYGLTAAYKQGLAGQGQTIVLLEGFGYPFIQADANAFSALNGLPQLTSDNFSIVYPEGLPVSPYIGDVTGWSGEIALDVQWAHAMAPEAKILVVATKGQNSEDFIKSMKYIIEHHLGNVVSDSWEENVDLVASSTQQKAFEDVLKVAAAEGISFQFSSGDGGDEGVGSPIGSAGVPSVAPHATAVGGTAILNTADKSFVSVGWGDVGGSIANKGGPIVTPQLYFFGGGGGGESVFWPKPAWQAALPGTGRQTPDISALSDPYTGAPIVLTSKGVQGVYAGNGGTSLGSPIFTAIWAIANQKAGHPLGQAAPLIAGLKTGVTDVVPMTSTANVSGAVTTASGTITYTTQDLFGPFTPQNQPFPATLTNQPSLGGAAVIGFSLDSSLTVTKGWDNATGYGTPDGLAFINAAAAYK